MPPTENDPSEDSPEPATETTSEPATPSPDRPGGRPGVSQADAIDEIDTWIARTGKPPSIRELRNALGNTGSMSTLSRYLREHAAERLLAGENSATGTAEDVVAKAVNAALVLLAADTASAADEAIAIGVREADARIAAAEGVKQRAVDKSQSLSEERERALGEVSSLTARVDALTADLNRVRTERDNALHREAASKVDYTALDTVLGQLQKQRDRLEAEQQHDRDALEQLRAQLLSQTERLAELATLCSQRESERDAARALHAREQDVLEETRQRLTTLSTELKQAQQHATRQHDQQARTIDALTAQVSALDAARLQAEALTQTATAERDALRAQESMFDDLKSTMAQWSQKLSDAEKSDSLSTSEHSASVQNEATTTK